jgi:hypothetical protein
MLTPAPVTTMLASLAAAAATAEEEASGEASREFEAKSGTMLLQLHLLRQSFVLLVSFSQRMLFLPLLLHL